MFSKLDTYIDNIEHEIDTQINSKKALHELLEIKKKYNGFVLNNTDNEIKSDRSIDKVISDLKKSNENIDLNTLNKLYVEGITIISDMENKNKIEEKKIMKAIEKNKKIKLIDISNKI